jgi:hypothetical protein
VGVKNPEGLHQQKLPKLHDPVRVCGVVCRQGKYSQAFLMRPRLERAILRTNDPLVVAALLKAAGEQQQLSLTAPQFFAGVDVDHLHSLHHLPPVAGGRTIAHCRFSIGDFQPPDFAECQPAIDNHQSAIQLATNH